MSLCLNYPGRFSESYLIGRIFGPDLFGATYVVISATYESEHDRMRAELRPMAPMETRIVLDESGRTWLMEDAR